MKRSYGFSASMLLALATAGCGGSAASVSPITQPNVAGAPSQAPADVHVVVIDAKAHPENSYAHILLKAAPPSKLGQTMPDGQSMSLTVVAVDSKGNVLSLNGATIVWSKPVHGTLSPASNGQSAQYKAPSAGTGVDTVGVTVTVPTQPGNLTASAAIPYSPHG